MPVEVIKDVRNQISTAMKFSLSLILLTAVPSVAFGNKDEPLTKRTVSSTCQRYCTNMVNKELPASKCGAAHSAGNKYVSKKSTQGTNRHTFPPFARHFFPLLPPHHCLFKTTVSSWFP